MEETKKRKGWTIASWFVIPTFLVSAFGVWWTVSQNEIAIDNAARAVTVEPKNSEVRDHKQTYLIQNDAELPIKNVRVVFGLPRSTALPQEALTSEWLADIDFSDPYRSCIDQSSAEMIRQIGSVKKGENREVEVPAVPVSEGNAPRVLFLEGNARGQWWEATTGSKLKKINEPPALEKLCNIPKPVIE